MSGPEPEHPQARRGVGPSDVVGKCVLLAVVIAISSLLLRSPGTVDVFTWAVWLKRLEPLGLTELYSRFHIDYPPGSFSLLALSKGVFAGSDFWAIKLLIGVFLLGTAAVAALWVRDVAAATVMIAALTVNALGLGYLDVLYAVPLLLAFWALQQDRLALFSAFFAAACLIKWQPLVLAPLLVIFLLRSLVGERGSLQVRRLIAAVVPGLSVCVVVALAFGVGPITSSIDEALTNRVFSGTALNFGWLLTALHLGSFDGGTVTYVFVSDVPSWMPILTRSLFALAMIAILVAFWRGTRSFEQLMAASIASVVAYFAFNTGVHENHLFLACLFSVIGLWLLPSLRMPLLVVIAMLQTNLIAFYGVTGALPYARTLGGIDVTVPLATLVVFACCFVVIRTLPYLTAPRRAERNPSVDVELTRT
jgi:hypothetical protein